MPWPHPGQKELAAYIVSGIFFVIAMSKCLLYFAVEDIAGQSDQLLAVGHLAPGGVGIDPGAGGVERHVLDHLAASEQRLVSDMSPGEITQLQSFLDRELSGTQVHYKLLGFEPGFESHFENSHLKELVSDLNEACARFGFQGQVLPMLALGRTDGRFFGSEGSMVYGCSPVLMGDSFDTVLPKVHGNDESILEDSYLFGCRVLNDILQKNCLCGQSNKEERDEGL